MLAWTGSFSFRFAGARHIVPLGDAKSEIEKAVTSLNFTVIQASWLMEVWLRPALGFDFANAAARIYGPGTNPISWVSFRDVAEICAVTLRHPAAGRKTIEFGGPEALSPLEVVARSKKSVARLSGWSMSLSRRCSRNLKGPRIPFKRVLQR